jgi:hypothetical protein
MKDRTFFSGLPLRCDDNFMPLVLKSIARPRGPPLPSAGRLLLASQQEFADGNSHVQLAVCLPQHAANRKKLQA